MSDYQQKYIKYKQKYESLKNMTGGASAVADTKFGKVSPKINYQNLYEATGDPVHKEIADAIKSGEITFQVPEEVKFPNDICKSKWIPFKNVSFCDNCLKMSKCHRFLSKNRSRRRLSSTITLVGRQEK